MNTVKLKVGNVFERNLAALQSPEKYRIIVNEGGTRSGKTFAILGLLLYAALQYSDRRSIISVVRRYSPQLRDSVYRDFGEIIEDNGLIPAGQRMPQKMQLNIGKSLFEFFGCDQAQKIRGRKRNILYINEANEIDLETFRQLLMRTTGTVFMDYNPSFTTGYIYDYVLSRPDVHVIKANYRDNPFLDANIIREIEALQFTDPAYWSVYGLGERANLGNTVYGGRWDYMNNAGAELLDRIRRTGIVVYGLDFGFTNPAACYRLCISKECMAFTVEKVFHEPYLSNEEIAYKILSCIARNNDQGVTIWADSAEPDRIKSIKDQGVTGIRGANKAGVLDGILTVRQFMQYVDPAAVEYTKELHRYRFPSDETGTPTGKELPIKADDHGQDATRYAVTSVFTRTKKGLMFG